MKDTFDERIVADPAVMVGKPIIKGTRITVEHILNVLGTGRSVEEVIQEYPRLTREDVLVAIQYARRIVEDERVFPLGAFQYA